LKTEHVNDKSPELSLQLELAGFRGVVKMSVPWRWNLPTSRYTTPRLEHTTRLEPRCRIAIMMRIERPSLWSISEIRECIECNTYPGTGDLASIWDQCGECNDPKIHDLPHVKHRPQHGLSSPLSLTPKAFSDFEQGTRARSPNHHANAVGSPVKCS
jgi:hypothetical protein